MEPLPETRGRPRSYPELYNLEVGKRTTYPKKATGSVRATLSRMTDREFITRVFDGKIWIERTK